MPDKTKVPAPCVMEPVPLTTPLIRVVAELLLVNAPFSVPPLLKVKFSAPLVVPPLAPTVTLLLLKVLPPLIMVQMMVLIHL